MTNILALDPGLLKPGLAYHADGRLVAAFRARIPEAFAQLDILDRSYRVAQMCVMQMEQRVPDWNIGLVVVEWPQWYGENGYVKGDEKKGIDPNDLAGLCSVAGAMIGILNERYGARLPTRSPKPREVWGTLKKVTKGDPWKCPRGARLASRLSPEERECVMDKHDALDAAALALWGADRWAPRRVMPGAV